MGHVSLCHEEGVRGTVRKRLETSAGTASAAERSAAEQRERLAILLTPEYFHGFHTVFPKRDFGPQSLDFHGGVFHHLFGKPRIACKAGPDALASVQPLDKVIRDGLRSGGRSVCRYRAILRGNV